MERKLETDYRYFVIEEEKNSMRDQEQAKYIICHGYVYAYGDFTRKTGYKTYHEAEIQYNKLTRKGSSTEFGGFPSNQSASYYIKKVQVPAA